MKKLILAALAVALCTSTASAQRGTSLRWAWEDVKFRTHIASEVGVAGDPGGVDSLAASGIAKFDTTAGVSTANWGMPDCDGNGVDSCTVARLMIFDSGLASVTVGKTSATAESIYIKTQVSPNGQIWFDAAVIPGHSPVLNAWTLQTTVNAGVIAFTVSQNAGISDKMWTLRFYKAQKGAGRPDAIDLSNIHTFPFVRWIISGTRATTNHSYRVRLGRLQDAAQ